MRKFGLGLDGCEANIENLIRQHVGVSQSLTYTVVEIGSAGCVTLRAMKDIVVENRKTPWRIMGFDLPDGWSLDWAEINRVFDGKPNILRDSDIGAETPENQMTLWLLKDPREFIKNKLAYPLDFVFIDGCHGKCAADDFLAIENKVVVGGIVMFHDFAHIDQGRDWQPHCGEFINVKKHLADIGLYDTRYAEYEKKEFRKGWRFLGEIQGSRYHGAGGNSCGIFQKIG